MQKIALAYKKRTGLFLHSCSRTTIGVWIATEPFIKVDINETLAGRGQAVLLVLTASSEPLPHPKQEEWGKVFEPMLKLAGATSLTAFEKDAACCRLEIDGEDLCLIPHRKRKGYLEIPDRAIKIQRVSSEATIGAALDDAFARCE
jgi:hypothetical protein